jgi:hypothetical protein
MKQNKVTIEELACMIGTSVQTINIWYKFKKHFPKDPKAKLLPEYTQEGPHRTRYWNTDDVWKIVEFKNSIVKGRKGTMGDITQRRIKSDRRM